MELLFADDRLQHLAQSIVRCDAHFGPSDGALVRQRLSELAAAENLTIAASVPTLAVRPLASGTGGFAVRVRARLRLVFQIVDRVAVERNSGVDFSKVQTIRILAFEECDEP